MTRILIVGAGMAGLACARALAEAGHRPLVLDKGRGIGGRIATRRVGDLQFDHGAQFVQAHGPGFAALLADLGPAMASWTDGSGRSPQVGQPGMSSLPKAMAAGLEVRQNLQVTSVTPEGGAFLVRTATETLHADRVVVTVPAPQVAGLLPPGHPLAAQVAEVRLAPCLTLMAAVEAPPPFVSRRDEGDDLSWIALDSSKPGRPQGRALWVAQAGEAFSQAHLEDSPEAIAARMVPLLCDRLGCAPDRVTHAQAHRWRYARVTRALGQDFLHHEGLYLGGDWCIGPRVEAAWTSGTELAHDLLAGL